MLILTNTEKLTLAHLCVLDGTESGRRGRQELLTTFAFWDLPELFSSVWSDQVTPMCHNHVPYILEISLEAQAGSFIVSGVAKRTICFGRHCVWPTIPTDLLLQVWNSHTGIFAICNLWVYNTDAKFGVDNIASTTQYILSILQTQDCNI